MTQPNPDQDRLDNDHLKEEIRRDLAYLGGMSRRIWDVGRKLSIARDRGFHLLDGKASVQEWAQGCGLKKSAAYQYIQIFEGFTAEQLEGKTLGKNALLRILRQPRHLRQARLDADDADPPPMPRRPRERLTVELCCTRLTGDLLHHAKYLDRGLRLKAEGQIATAGSRQKLRAVYDLFRQTVEDFLGADSTAVENRPKPAEPQENIETISTPVEAPAAAPDPGPASEPDSGRPERSEAESKAPAPGPVGEYEPEPVPRRALVLPPDWEDHSYLYKPSAIACSRFAHESVAGPEVFKHTAILGLRRRTGQPVALDYSTFPALALYGVPRSGKTYFQALLIEGALLKDPLLACDMMPFCGVALNYGRESQLLCSVFANRRNKEVHRLMDDCHVLPQGLPDIVALVPAARVERMRLRHPHIQVHPLQFPCRELGKPELHHLFHLQGKDWTLHGSEVDQMIDRLLAHGPLTLGRLEAEVLAYPFTLPRARALVLAKLQSGKKWIDDDASLRSFVKPRRLIVVDIQEGELPEEEALMAFGVATQILAVRPEEERRCGILLCWDEAYRFVRHRRVREQMVGLIRERRHLGVLPVVSSQDPLSVPDELHGLLDGLAVGQHNAPKWNRHLSKSLHICKFLSAEMTAKLLPGEIWLWARHYWQPHDAEDLADRMLIVQARARASQHGGETWSPAGQGTDGDAAPTIVYR